MIISKFKYTESTFAINDIYEDSLLVSAAQNGCLDLVKDLVKEGHNINSLDNNGNLPIVSAAKNGHLDTVKYLIKKGANINSKDNNGDTPLSIALENQHEDIVKYLLQQKKYRRMPAKKNTMLLLLMQY